MKLVLDNNYCNEAELIMIKSLKKTEKAKSKIHKSRPLEKRAKGIEPSYPAC